MFYLDWEWVGRLDRPRDGKQTGMKKKRTMMNTNWESGVVPWTPSFGVIAAAGKMVRYGLEDDVPT